MRVLCTSTSGWGHIHPMVPLARAFLDRGDEVLRATGDEVCGRLQREGIETSVAGLDDGVAMAMFYERYPEVSDVPPPERSDFMFPPLFGAVRAEAMLAGLVPAARAHAPISSCAMRPNSRVAATGVAVEPIPHWVSEPSSEPLVHVTLGTVFSNNDVLSTVIGALRELPQLCLPQAADQFYNVAACARAGTGIALTPDARSARGERRRRHAADRGRLPRRRQPGEPRDRRDGIPDRSRGQVARQLRMTAEGCAS